MVGRITVRAHGFPISEFFPHDPLKNMLFYWRDVLILKPLVDLLNRLILPGLIDVLPCGFGIAFPKLCCFFGCNVLSMIRNQQGRGSRKTALPEICAIALR